jgi:hypothetical protein
MPEHVRMNRERKLGGFASALNHPQEPTRRYWCACLSGEHIRRVAQQWPQRSELWPMQRMNTLAIDVQSPTTQINLSPTQRAELSGAEPVPIRK